MEEQIRPQNMPLEKMFMSVYQGKDKFIKNVGNRGSYKNKKS